MTAEELSHYPVIFPVERSIISSTFGMRRHPVYKVRKFHTGIDIAKAKGIPVYATGGGVVIRRGYDAGYGNFVEIEHSGGFRSFYAHLGEVAVARGDTVEMAAPIACVGDSGVTTGSHLHYEVRKNGRFLNPSEWCCCLRELLKSIAR
jgi:murein DD-endopeptidase MepM/ murein hydrolase activator NlpD